MNKLEDAPELKAAFEKAARGVVVNYYEQPLAEHFFIAGRDSLRDECESVKPKRTIAEVHEIDGEIYVVSNDRKMFSWQGNQLGWYALPDLPQE